MDLKLNLKGLLSKKKAKAKAVAEEAVPEPAEAVPEPIVIVTGAPVAPSSPGGFVDYYHRETGAHVQAVQRLKAFRLYTDAGESAGEAGDYWVRPTNGPPRVVKRESFESQFERGS